MNPLSAWTFNLRHKRRAALIIGLVILITTGLYLLGSIMWGSFIAPARDSYLALSKFDLITLNSNENISESELKSRILEHPEIEKIIPTTTITIDLATIIPDEEVSFSLFGMKQDDLPYFLSKFDAKLIAGDYFEPNTNGLLLSKDVASILGLKVGDPYELVSTEFYGSAGNYDKPVPMRVVGILDSDVRLGIMSLGFVRNQMQYEGFPPSLLVSTKENSEKAVDQYLQDRFQKIAGVSVKTFSILNERIIEEAFPVIGFILPVIAIIITAFSQIIALVIKISNTRRIRELGILHAVGYTRKSLSKRLSLEVMYLIWIGWVIGIGLSIIAIFMLNTFYLQPKGHYLNYLGWMPILFTFPILIAHLPSSRNIKRTLSNLDPIAAIEQGSLLPKYLKGRRQFAAESYDKPLAPTLYIKRHKKQTVPIIGVLTLDNPGRSQC